MDETYPKEIMGYHFSPDKRVYVGSVVLKNVPEALAGVATALGKEGVNLIASESANIEGTGTSAWGFFAEAQDSVEMVNKLYDEGHYICFFTARTEEHKEVTESWLRQNGVRYHQVIFNKPRKLEPYSGYHFIDDAHVRATTFRGKFTDFVKKTVVIDAFED